MLSCLSPLVSYSYRTEHITTIPPKRAAHRLTVCSVNTAEIRLRSSHGVSSDPEQRDVFSSYRCQQASENSATPFKPSLLLFVTSSPPGSLFPEQTEGQTNRERRHSCAAAGDTQTFSRCRRLFLPPPLLPLSLSLRLSYILAGASLSGRPFNRCPGRRCQQRALPSPLSFPSSLPLSWHSRPGLSPNMG